jgi:hypothetical protein
MIANMAKFVQQEEINGDELIRYFSPNSLSMLEAGHKLGIIEVATEHYFFAVFKLRDFAVSCSSAHFAFSGRHSTGLEPVYHANWLHEDPYRLKKESRGLFYYMRSTMFPDGMLTFPTIPRRLQMDERTANVCTEPLSWFNMFLTITDHTGRNMFFWSCFRHIVHIASYLSMVPLTKAEAGI